MIRKYKYRFKTEKEFINDYGEKHWRNIPMGFVVQMNYLLGKTIEDKMGTDNISLYDDIDHMFSHRGIDHVNYNDSHSFSVSREMITKEDILPNYKPKTFVR